MLANISHKALKGCVLSTYILAGFLDSLKEVECERQSSLLHMVYHLEIVDDWKGKQGNVSA
jgi:hypothetical protein